MGAVAARQVGADGRFTGVPVNLPSAPYFESSLAGQRLSVPDLPPHPLDGVASGPWAPHCS